MADKDDTLQERPSRCSFRRQLTLAIGDIRHMGDAREFARRLSDLQMTD